MTFWCLRSINFIWLGISCFHYLPSDFIHGPFDQILIISLSSVLFDFRHFQLWHINHWLLGLSFARWFLCRSWGCFTFCSACRIFLFLFNPLQLLDLLFLLVFLKSLFLKLLLLFFGLFDKKSLDLISLGLFIHFEGDHALSLELKEECVHGLRMSIHYLDILYIVVAVSSSDLI